MIKHPAQFQLVVEALQEIRVDDVGDCQVGPDRVDDDLVGVAALLARYYSYGILTGDKLVHDIVRADGSVHACAL